MLLTLLQNFWLGFVITATPGAVLAEALRRSLKPNLLLSHFLLGNFTGMGIVIAIAIAFAGVEVQQESITGTLFFLCSGLLLVYIGVSTLMTKTTSKQRQASSKGSGSGAFVTGLVLSVANPLSYIFWLSLVGQFQSNAGYKSALLQTLCVILGAATVFTIITIMARYFGTVLNLQRQQQLSIIFGVIIIGFGIAILVRAFPL